MVRLYRGSPQMFTPTPRRNKHLEMTFSAMTEPTCRAFGLERGKCKHPCANPFNTKKLRHCFLDNGDFWGVVNWSLLRPFLAAHIRRSKSNGKRFYS